MSEQTEQQETQRQATAEPTTPAPATGTAPDKTESPATSETRFTQADLNKAVQERLERERRKFADYDELKAKAAKWQEIEDAAKSEQDKLADKLKTYEQQLADIQSQNVKLAEEKAQTLLRAEIVAKAAKAGFTDPDDAYRILDRAKVKTTDAGFEGIDEALKELADAKPYLLRATTENAVPRLGATNPGHGTARGETDAEKRNRLFGPGQSPFGKHGGGVIMPG